MTTPKFSTPVSVPITDCPSWRAISGTVNERVSFVAPGPQGERALIDAARGCHAEAFVVGDAGARLTFGRGRHDVAVTVGDGEDGEVRILGCETLQRAREFAAFAGDQHVLHDGEFAPRRQMTQVQARAVFDRGGGRFGRGCDLMRAGFAHRFLRAEPDRAKAQRERRADADGEPGVDLSP
jgi:hypothetical protein